MNVWHEVREWEAVAMGDDVENAFVSADRGIWVLIVLAFVGVVAVVGVVAYAVFRAFWIWG